MGLFWEIFLLNTHIRWDAYLKSHFIWKRKIIALFTSFPYYLPVVWLMSSEICLNGFIKLNTKIHNSSRRTVLNKLFGNSLRVSKLFSLRMHKSSWQKLFSTQSILLVKTLCKTYSYLNIYYLIVKSNSNLHFTRIAAHRIAIRTLIWLICMALMTT